MDPFAPKHVFLYPKTTNKYIQNKQIYYYINGIFILQVKNDFAAYNERLDSDVVRYITKYLSSTFQLSPITCIFCQLSLNLHSQSKTAFRHHRNCSTLIMCLIIDHTFFLHFDLHTLSKKRLRKRKPKVLFHWNCCLFLACRHAVLFSLFSTQLIRFY